MHGKNARKMAARLHHEKHARMSPPGHGRGRGGRGGGRGSGRGRGRGRQADAPPTSIEELSAWFAGNLPDDWFLEPAAIVYDRDEIIVGGHLAMPKIDDKADPSVAARERMNSFRETTRDARIAIAARAEATFERKVSWRVECGEEHADFTVSSVPVMTRLHMDERQVLDTLIDAGVARSRSEALAWAVRLVGENEAEWIESLRSAMTEVEELRNQGPASKS